MNLDNDAFVYIFSVLFQKEEKYRKFKLNGI